MSLKHLLDQKLSTTLQQKWISKLLGFDYEVQYKKGTENRAADVLSRREEMKMKENNCRAITQVQPLWMERVIKNYGEDEEIQEILASKLIDNQSYPDYTLNGGISRYRGRICIRRQKKIKEMIMIALHDSPLGGHSGIQVTYQRIKAFFHWVGMKKSIEEFVKECDICQGSKDEHVPYPGLLNPLPIPQQSWSHIVMDFIDGLPKSEGKSVILTVVDRFSKYGYFLALSHPYTVEGVAKVFLDNIYRLHGMPRSIVSDRDKIFTSTFWRQLFKLAGVSLDTSSAYHSQSDGQSERLNQCVEGYLRCMVQGKPKQWVKWLPLAEYLV